MERRNSGRSEINVLQNKFTAYLLKAIRRQKCDYHKKRIRQQAHEVLIDCQVREPIDEGTFDPMMDSLSPMMQIEDLALLQALNRLTIRERYILFEHILNERSYEELAKPLGLRYSGVSTAYRRIIQKLRKELGGGDR